MNWYLKVVRDHYLDFKGRARRKEYWMFVLINVIISAILGLLDQTLGLNYGDHNEEGILETVYGLLVFLPSLAVTVRRLHDYGKSGWYILLILIPIIGWIWLLVWLCMEGENKQNQWGPNPKGVGNLTAIDSIGKE
ncbi:DUF805 domain-containing protein [uncultured Polaribacter sp.]|uniref:DUF805 domain-containing protein n=1 Tax=uncultured Polaribacter sp. TaxID=174711 RepID=UPI00260F6042|nr:DUF805 domain-containing protein [uncultured Polaribacter sp.]